ncbi:MAG: L-threonylcarbamoyladenylate synthase [Roseobacter sp.]
MASSSHLILSPDPQDVDRAAALLAAGELVAFPTETVYGLGADARNGRAVASIFEVKGRPHFNPLIVHLANVEHARSMVEWSGAAEKLAASFWPGPLTLVLPLKPDHGLSSLVTAGLSTVALRVPAHPTARALLAAFGGPVAAPSANPSGRISPTTAQHVLHGLGGKIAAVLDDGPCAVGLESTIVCLGKRPKLLRAGGIATEDIETALGAPLEAAAPEQISAPGQLASHYAPDAPVRLDVMQPRADEVYIGFGDMTCTENLSRAGDLVEAASRLFDCLHRMNATGKPIAVAPIPHTGLGAAINDRLQRAAAPRPNKKGQD